MTNTNSRSKNVRLLLVFAATVVLASAPSARALSPAPLSNPGSSTGTTSTTALGYMTHGDSYYDILDVDGDRMSLRVLLEPPSAPMKAVPTPVPVQEASTPSRSSSRSSSIRAVGSRSRTSERISPVTALHSIQDYQRHVLHAPNQLCIIRFSAPFCKVCRTTSVSWERMASKIHKSGGERIKFLSVSVDGKDEDTLALKDLLRVEKVPQGILHHPARGVLGSKVDLNRANLTALRKRLERYVEEGPGGGPLFDVPEFQL